MKAMIKAGAFKEYKENIEGYRDVMSSARASQKIAASELVKRYQSMRLFNETASETVAFWRRYEEVFGRVSELFEIKREKMLVVIMGEKGLCGDLYVNVAVRVSRVSEEYSEVILIGEAGDKYLEEEKVKIDKSFGVDDFEEVFEYVFEKFTMEKMEVDLVYAEPVSLSKSTPTLSNVLGVVGEFLENKEVKVGEGLPVLGSEKEKIRKMLVRQVLHLNFYGAILKASVSELSSRTVATENAETKAKEVLDRLKLEYFKERRLFVTQSQLEGFLAHK